MTKHIDSRNDRPTQENDMTRKPYTPRTKEEQRVWDVLERARQNVKPVVKRESEGAQVDSDLLNLRLRRSR